MTRRRAARVPDPPADTPYPLVATAADLLQLLRRQVAPSLRTQAAAHLTRGPAETAAAYLARLGDELVDEVGAVLEATREGDA